MLYAQVDEAYRKELETELKSNPRMKRYRRLKVIDQLSKGQSVSEIASLFYLHHKYNAGDLDSLKLCYGVGLSVKINVSKAEMEERISQSPNQFEKLETGTRNWTQGLLCQYLWPYHQLKISQSGISDALKRLGIV